MKKFAGILLIFTLIFIFLMLSSAQEVLIGDVNLDGKVTATDARAVLRFATQLDKCDDNQRLIADANKDGKVTAVDARAVLRIAARLIESPGIVNIEEQPTNDGRVSTGSVIGMSIKDFRAKFDSVIEVASSSNAKYYKNKDITLICDPAIYKDGSISAFIITSEKYSFNSVGIGDSADRVQKQFSAPWVSAVSYSDDKTFENDNLIVTVKIKDNKVTEVAVETKIAEDPTTEAPTTEAPTTEVPTTESPTTEAPTTQEPTTEAPTTKPLDGNTILLKDAPEQIIALAKNDFAIIGKMESDEGTNDFCIFTKNGMTRADVNSLEVEEGKPLDLSMLIKKEKDIFGKEISSVYLLNNGNKKYLKLSQSLIKEIGINPESIALKLNFGDIETALVQTSQETVSGITYSVYTVGNTTNPTKIYMLDNNIKMLITNGNKVIIDTFTYPTDDALYTLNGYKEADGLLEPFKLADLVGISIKVEVKGTP